MILADQPIMNDTAATPRLMRNIFLKEISLVIETNRVKTDMIMPMLRNTIIREEKVGCGQNPK